jgi:protein TonB
MPDVALETARVFPSLLVRARARLRENLGRRAIGAALALAIEALLFWALISIGEIELPHKIVPLALNSFDVRTETHPAAEHQKKPKDQAVARAAATQLTVPQPTQMPKQIAPAPQPPAIIPLSPQVQSFDLGKIARAPVARSQAGPLIGPVDTPRFGDSERVGTAPNGQPMYKAAWYPYEPSDQQMAGYLSTAEPGWALVTCKTVPDYRVEDCVGLDEYPDNSHLIQSVLAAAWQFRVRPPRVNGVLQVGDWVRIRISYEELPATNPYTDQARRSR